MSREPTERLDDATGGLDASATTSMDTGGTVSTGGTASTGDVGQTTTGGHVGGAGQAASPSGAGGTQAATGGTPVDAGGTPLATGGTPLATGGTPLATGGTPVDAGGTEPSCPAGATGSAGQSRETVLVGGVSRSYILYVPSGYTGDTPVPLMLNFHPLLASATAAESSSGYKELADREGFIVAFPDSQADAAWNLGGVCCTRDPDVDDLGFARALVEQVQSNYCVDEKRVYASGFSMGAGMAHYLACEAADLFAAVATGHFDLLGENSCTPTRPITVFSYRSNSDFIVPYAGGLHRTAPNGFIGDHTLLGAVETFERWAEINGCTGQPVAGDESCQTYEQCSEGVEVTLCTVGGGHVYPDAEGSWAGISGFSLP